MGLHPLGDRLIVKALEAEEKSRGGIVLPDAAKERPQEGKVLAVGKGKLLEDGTVKSLEVKTGDRVLFGKYAGTEVKVEGDDVLILREDDILAIIGK